MAGWLPAAAVDDRQTAGDIGTSSCGMAGKESGVEKRGGGGGGDCIWTEDNQPASERRNSRVCGAVGICLMVAGNKERGAHLAL